MEKINGFITAPFTPFDRHGNLNLQVIEDYSDLVVRNGMDGVFICGTSGEGFSLTNEERKAVAEKWIEEGGSKLKIIVHVGATGIKDSQDLADHARQNGAWGISIVDPVFFKPSDLQGLFEYCQEIAKTTPDLPFYYYYIPGFTGNIWSMVSFLKMVNNSIPNFAGVKYTHQDLFEFNQCMMVENRKFEMLHGVDETLLHGLFIGAKSGIGGTYNHCFPIYKAVIDNFYLGNIEEAKNMQNKSQSFINIISKYGGNVIAGKRVMKFIGVDCGPNRLPLRSLFDENEKKMKEDLEVIGFFEFCNK